MTDTSTLQTHGLALPDRDPLPPPPEDNTRALLRPFDLIVALTGLALLFFTLFVYAVAEWRYFGTDVDYVSPLGWIVPLVAGALCVLSTAVTVASRAAQNARVR